MYPDLCFWEKQHPAPAVTLEEIQQNVKSAFENMDVMGAYGYVLMINEIAIEVHSCWDPTTNNILSLCLEHTAHLSLKFCLINNVKVLFRGILDGECHYAKEVHVS
jgi:hypothetical protein